MKKLKLYNPDFVVYTGDFISYQNKEQFQQIQEVLKHTVRGKLGTLGILGNHDYGHNWSQQSVADEIGSQLQLAGIDLLNNQELEKRGLNFIRFELYWFDDFWGLNFGPQKIMNMLDNSKANIVLCHNPDVCDIDIWNGYKGWILSGHTHGGQCKPPFLPPPILPVKNKSYTSGLFEKKAFHITCRRPLYIYIQIMELPSKIIKCNLLFWNS